MKPEHVVGAFLLGLTGLGLLFILSGPVSTDSLPRTGASVPYTEIVRPSGFVNTEGITMAELIGKKVILVDFLTYSCINCQRTFPYLNAWYEKYKNEGLEIVGIHTPEFAFEKDIKNVENAMREFGIVHPIVLDNDYATWNAYGNRYWPRKYLIDIHGNVVYDHIGEGAYEETEMKIQELLKERARVIGDVVAPSVGLASSGVVSEKVVAQSPETYFGSLRNEYLANGNRVNGVQKFSIPDSLLENALYFGGVWNVQGEYAEAVREARVAYRFRAKEVYVVAEAAVSTDVRVYLDGVLVIDSAGADVSDGSLLRVKESRLYKIIRLEGAEEHTLELEADPGVRFFAFTFG